jgi:hypothetical protein
MTRERLQELSRRCRELQKRALVLEIKEQLEIWEIEFAMEAAGASAVAQAEQAPRGIMNLAISRS